MEQVPHSQRSVQRAGGGLHARPIRVTETSAENLEGERKTVTAPFADIKARWT